MSDFQRRVVLVTFVEIAILTALGPLVYIYTQSEMIIIFWLSFNAALNIVAYEYALRGYFAARPIAEAWEQLKRQADAQRTERPGLWKRLKRLINR